MKNDRTERVAMAIAADMAIDWERTPEEQITEEVSRQEIRTVARYAIAARQKPTKANAALRDIYRTILNASLKSE